MANTKYHAVAQSEEPSSPPPQYDPEPATSSNHVETQQQPAQQAQQPDQQPAMTAPNANTNNNNDSSAGYVPTAPPRVIHLRCNERCCGGPCDCSLSASNCKMVGKSCGMASSTAAFVLLVLCIPALGLLSLWLFFRILRG